MRIWIDWLRSDADREIEKIARVLRNPRALLKSWGNAVAILARKNAREKGGRRFWNDVAKATRLKSVNDSEAVVECDHVAGAFKHAGGVIKAKNASALTIPISEEAKGKRAAEFEMGGKQLFRPKGTSVLGYSENGEFHPLYALRKSVFQKPDPWWPDDDTVLDIGLKEAGFWLDRELRGKL